MHSNFEKIRKESHSIIFWYRIKLLNSLRPGQATPLVSRSEMKTYNLRVILILWSFVAFFVAQIDSVGCRDRVQLWASRGESARHEI
jgi:hypothetical protein